MNKLGIWGIAIATAFVIGVLSANPVAEAVGETVNLSGHLEDDNGNPVSAKVELFNGPGSNVRTFPDSNGDYSLDVIPGIYTLGISDNGEQPNTPRFYNLQKSIDVSQDAVQDLVFPLVTLSGTVRDGNGVDCSDVDGIGG